MATLLPRLKVYLLMSGDVTLACVSYNREQALRDTVPSKLALQYVTEIIFVLDGSTDGSEHYLRDVAQNDPRVRVVWQERQGPQAARNRALAETTTPWIFFIDDDDFVPAGHLAVLLEEARRHGASIVGTPWVNLGIDVLAERIVALRNAAVDRPITLRDRSDVFSLRDELSPFMCSIALMKTADARAIGYDSGFHGNSWREETDFYLRAVGSGLTVLRTSRSFAWRQVRYSGGHTRPAIAVEFWIAINEFRFLVRHRQILHDLEPGWNGVVIEWLKTIAPRLGMRATSMSRKLSGRGGL